MPNISVIGAGAWGSALAQVIAAKNKAVTLWTRYEDHARSMNMERENAKYLPGIALHSNIKATGDIAHAMRADILLMVTPAQALRVTLEAMKPHIRPEHVLVLCAKGIEQGSDMMMSDVAAGVLPDTPVAVLSGPNFAHEIAAGRPAATTLACADAVLGEDLQKSMASPKFRPYLSEDVIGVQIAGALKNVIAICCGIIEGVELGQSARASIVTRGLAEIARLGCAMGAKRETFMGLSGVGDMMLTCSSEKSRNFSLGYAMGRGQNLDDILKGRTSVTEGVYTAQVAVRLSQRWRVDLPICDAVHKCLKNKAFKKEFLEEMMDRPLRYEM